MLYFLRDVTKYALSDQQSETQRYTIYSDIKLRKYAHPHINKQKTNGTNKYLAFLLEED